MSEKNNKENMNLEEKYILKDNIILEINKFNNNYNTKSINDYDDINKCINDCSNNFYNNDDCNSNFYNNDDCSSNFYNNDDFVDELIDNCVIGNNRDNVIIIALLYNNRNEDLFKEYKTFNLKKIEINYYNFLNLFFNDYDDGFTYNLINKIWKNNKIPLINLILEYYEEKTNLNRNKINPIKLIELYKECFFDNITDIIERYYSVNKKVIDIIIKSSNINANLKKECVIEINLYFKSLDLSLKFKFKLILNNIY